MKKKIFSILALLCMAVTGAWAEEITIGDPTSTTTNAYLPSYSLYEYSLSQQIYTADEIGTSGTINALTMWLKNSSSYPRNYNIYMKEVSQSSFADGNAWVSMAESNLVATATLSNGITDPVETTFTLTTPFEYSGTGNLVICFQDVTGQWSSGVASVVMTTSGHQAIYAYRDGSLYDPTSPGVIGSFATKDSEGVKSVVKFDISASVVNKPFELTMAEDAEAHGTIIFKVNNVRTNPDDNGVVGVDVDDEVTVTITPDEGWVVNKPTGEWIAAFANAPRRVQDVDMDHFFDLTLVSENEETGAKTYTFTMTPANVEISCSYKQITTVAFPEEEYEAQFKEPFESPVAMTDPDDLPLVYSSSDESIATVDPQTGEVTFVNIGEVVITASYEGDDDKLPAEGSYTLTITHREFDVNIDQEPYALVTPSAVTAIEYQEVTITVAPMTGYVIKSVELFTEGGEPVEFTEAEGKDVLEMVYTFTMPYDNVTFKVTFEDKNFNGFVFTDERGNTFSVTDPDNLEVVVTGLNADADGKVVIPVTVFNEETQLEYTVTGISNDAMTGNSGVTDVYVENQDEVLDIDGETFVTEMPDAKLHVYQTLLKDYAEAMPELLADHKLVTDIEVTDPVFTYSNFASVILPEGMKQHKASVVGATALKGVAAAPAIVTVEATPIESEILPASTGVVMTAEPGVYELAATLENGNGSYEGNNLRPIEKKTIFSAFWGVYNMQKGVFVPIDETYRIVDDCRAILKIEAASMPEKIEVEFVEPVVDGINTIDNSQLATDNCYDLNGRKMQGKLTKGVYVINGKKVVVK